MNQKERAALQVVVLEVAEVLEKHNLSSLQALEALDSARHYYAGSAAVLGWEGLKAKAHAGQVADTLLLKFIE